MPRGKFSKFKEQVSKDLKFFYKWEMPAAREAVNAKVDMVRRRYENNSYPSSVAREINLFYGKQG